MEKCRAEWLEHRRLTLEILTLGMFNCQFTIFNLQFRDLTSLIRRLSFQMFQIILADHELLLFRVQSFAAQPDRHGARQCSTYQMSCSIRSGQLNVLRPFTCAQPVTPGRTSSRRRWRGVYCST